MASNRKPETLVARHFRTSTLPCTRLSGLPIICSLGPCSIETRIENGKPTYDSLGSGYSSIDSGLGTRIENGKLSYVSFPDPFVYSLASLSLCRFREIMYTLCPHGSHVLPRLTIKSAWTSHVSLVTGMRLVWLAAMNPPIIATKRPGNDVCLYHIQ